MVKIITYFISLVLLTVLASAGQQVDETPFASLERAVRESRGGWAGDKSKLSAVFDAERKRLGTRFERELLEWLRTDPERHYWISSFLESESYLHGSKPLAHLSLLVKQQGLVLVQNKEDEESRGYVVRFSITAAVLSAELGFRAMGSSYKNEAESLLVRQPELSVFVPGFTEADRRTYEGIKSAVSRKMPVTDESNPQPTAKVTAGILNSRALNRISPVYPSDARKAGASGNVEVQVVFDETGRVIWAKARSGHPLLHQAAENAARQTRFAPTRLSGQPVKTVGVMVYNFTP